jgi:hypothetical protein
MMLNRTNPRGQEYILYQGSNSNQTIISYRGKRIMVPHSLDKISQSWYCWQMRGDFIQHAFPYLTAGEREFLMTGLLDEEFEALFPPE